MHGHVDVGGRVAEHLLHLYSCNYCIADTNAVNCRLLVQLRLRRNRFTTRMLPDFVPDFPQKAALPQAAELLRLCRLRRVVTALPGPRRANLKDGTQARSLQSLTHSLRGIDQLNGSMRFPRPAFQGGQNSQSPGINRIDGAEINFQMWSILRHDCPEQVIGSIAANDSS